MNKMFYLIKWLFSVKFLGQKKPLQSVIFITDKCNLRCRHCCIVKKSPCRMMSYEQVKVNLLKCYKDGSRFVDFEGGEPSLWRDGEKNINDLISLAKEIGFYSTTVTTNAQLPIIANSDLIWISLDGNKEAHDKNRGIGAYKNAMANIEKSNHPCLNINMTISKLNKQTVEEVANFALKNEKIKKISFNFYTPSKKDDEMMLSRKEKNEIIDKIIELKKKNYPIMNSFSGLNELKKEITKENSSKCWITSFVDVDGKYTKGCLGAPQICENCGFAMRAEMKSVFDLKIDTLLSGLDLRVKK